MRAWLRQLNRFRHLVILTIIMLCLYTIYFIQYYQPFTNNAFVIANIRPITSQVSGKVESIYVKNGDKVKTGQKLFKIDDTLYKHERDEALHAVESTKIMIPNLKKQLENDKLELKIEQHKLEVTKMEYDDAKNLVKTSATSKFNYFAKTKDYLEQRAEVSVAKNNIKITEMDLLKQQAELKKAIAALKSAEYKLNETTVYAKTDGFVSNMHISKGTAVTALTPIFSFIDTNNYWVQANYKETDLGEAYPGQKASIVLRLYGKKKIFKGEVVSINWAVDRRLTNSYSYLAMVDNENQWTLMAQRFPVIIKILDPDKKYPLPVGASAYVTLE